MIVYRACDYYEHTGQLTFQFGFGFELNGITSRQPLDEATKESHMQIGLLLEIDILFSLSNGPDQI
jgi:hypothetical protein